MICGQQRWHFTYALKDKVNWDCLPVGANLSPKALMCYLREIVQKAYSLQWKFKQSRVVIN